MCSLCDGTSYEQLLEDTGERIERIGFTMVGVEADLDHPPWTYTIGLVEGYDHPELAMLGIPIELAAEVISALATRVLDGDRIVPGVDLLFDGVPFHVDEVDQQLWAGERFNQWKAYYDWTGDPPATPSAIEVIPCGSWHDGFAAEAPPPNRAARRARHRGRGHGGHGGHGGS